MRKFTKILAALLVAMLLVSMVAISAFSATDNANQLVLTGNGIYNTSYFSNTTATSSKTLCTTDFQDQKKITTGTMVSRGALERFLTDGVYYIDSEGNPVANIYYNIYSDGTTRSATSSPYTDALFNHLNPSHGFFYDDYIVLTLDVTADSYVLPAETFFGSDYSLLQADADGLYAVYIAADEEKGIAAGDYYLVNGNKVTFDDQLIFHTNFKEDSDGYVVYAEGNTLGGTAGERFKDTAGTTQNIKFSSLKLSYTTAMTNSLMFSTYKSPSSTTRVSNAFTYTYNSNNNQWSIKFGNGTKELSKVAGVWNSISIVIAPDNTVNYTLADDTKLDNYPYDKDIVAGINALADGETYTAANGNVYSSYTLNISKTKVYLYLDGEYVGFVSPYSTTFDTTYKASVITNYNSSGDAYADAYALRTQISSANFNKAGTIYSIGHDNVSVHYYTKGYTGDLAQLMKDDPTNPLYNCDDVVHDADYFNSNAPTTFVYSDATAQTQVAGYNFAAGAIDYAVENGGYVILNKSVKNYAFPDDLTSPKTVYIKLEDGATLTLAEGSEFVLSDEPDANGYYTLEKPENAYVYWYVTDGAATADTEGVVDEGASIEYPDTLPETEYIGDGSIYGIVGWEYSTALDGTYTEFTPELLTQELIDEANAADGKLYVRAIYETQKTAYTIEQDGEISWSMDESKFASDFNALTGTYTVTLWSDIHGSINGYGTDDTFTTIAIEENATLDLNGYDLIITHTKGSGTAPSVFRIRENTTFNLYSSKENGVIWTTAATLIRIGTSTNSAKLENITINVGATANSKYSGDNLAFYGAMLINFSSDAKVHGEGLEASTLTPTTTDEDGNVVVDKTRLPVFNINGGQYIRTEGITYALITMRGSAILNAENAIFVSCASENSRVFSTDSRYFCNSDVTFTNCDILAIDGTSLSSVFKEVQEGTTLTFNNCRITGNLDFGGGIEYFTNYYKVTSISNTYYLKEENIPEKYAGQYTLSTSTTAINTTYMKDLDRTIYNKGTVVIGAGTLTYGSYYTTNPIVDRDNFKTRVALKDSVAYDNSYSTATVEDGNVVINSASRPVEFAYVSIPTVEYNKQVPASLKVNITTNNGFLINVYVENGAAYTVEGLTHTDVIIGGVNYTVYTTTAIAPSSTEAASIVLSGFTYGEYAYTHTVEISLLDYFTRALENAEAGSVEKALIINAANYCNKVYKYATGEEYEAYTTIVSKADAGMIVTEFGDAIREITEGQTTIEEAGLIVTDGNIPMFAFMVKGEQTDVYATYTNIYGEKITLLCPTADDKDDEGNVIATYYVIPDMKIYDMNKTITLSLDAEGTDVIIKYNLAAYIASAAGQTVEVDEALYSFAVASYNYKTTE